MNIFLEDFFLVSIALKYLYNNKLEENNILLDLNIKHYYFM